ncbi:2-polyprenyl-6-methoxyphenol hydroxylase and related FAD-dependent oxidoreductases [Mycobacterium rhizamassiliense]|uniref:2-polyprenyl-6-methoxyphenol hydroxylase and related FAD-dependent oxidoreductases n=2 Tax=Mycobacterium rhizamassiliense TaxID=1841860 RepID=A0A2U3NXQ9_9MYCO|nr:2-polyprenyl-6-methoxyphenol hydroxylase and related FAD-dependent oxidoreductases [Mycobacterium rhizamassiliense]
MNREHAVVLGAGMAGLFAARVLSEQFDSVTVVERDRLPGYPTERKGVPQGRHLHNFLSRGVNVMTELFPGILDELATAGAVVATDGDLSRMYVRFGGSVLKRSGTLSDPGLLTLCPATRPFLEFHVRRRVTGLPNVTFLDEHDVAEPLVDGDAVTGVRITKRNTGFASTLAADLVVDTMGRASRTPAFLEGLGYGRPAEDRTEAKVAYSSQRLSIPKGRIAEHLVMFNPGGGQPGGLLVAGEHDTWTLAIAQLVDVGHPPTDFAAMITIAEQALPAAIANGLRSAQPIGEAVTYRHTSSVWRRYDQMPTFPSGLLVMGDAVCSLDPIYGQGMTVAALEAQTLRDCLRSGDAQLAQHFFTAAAQYIGSTWASNRARDRHAFPVRTRRSVRQLAEGWFVKAVLNAAANDVAVTERFLRISNLIDSQAQLQDPALLARIVAANLRALFTQTRTHAAKGLAAGNASGRLRPMPSTVVGRCSR